MMQTLHRPRPHTVGRRSTRRIGEEARLDPFALGLGQPRSIGGAVGQPREHEQPQEHGGQPFEEEQPLPPGEAQAAVEAEQAAGERAHDGRAQGCRDVEPGEGATAKLDRKPL
jgi:hypothetical protein